MEELFEEKYLEADVNFLKLVETYTGYRGDEALKEMVLHIYQYIQSSPFPKEWLKEKISQFQVKEENDFAKTIWGEILLEEYKNTLLDTILSLKNIKCELDENPELEKFSMAIRQDIEI